MFAHQRKTFRFILADNNNCFGIVVESLKYNFGCFIIIDLFTFTVYLYLILFFITNEFFCKNISL